MAADAKPSIEALLELFESTGKHELADLEALLGVILERYEEVRALTPADLREPAPGRRDDCMGHTREGGLTRGVGVRGEHHRSECPNAPGT